MVYRNIILALVLLTHLFVTKQTAAQEKTDTSITYVVTKNDGTVFVGKILSKDAREYLMDTKSVGQVSVPKHDVRTIRQAYKWEIDAKGDYHPGDMFATRYFITTNGLSIEKGESYVIWGLLGPDFQFGVADNFTIGLMTTWYAVPIIGTAKYSFDLGENTHLGVGTLLGTGSWAIPQFGLALPFASFTYGDRRYNATVSAGYGAAWANGWSGGRFMYSVAGMAKVSKKLSLVFDSFILPQMPGNDFGISFIVPSLRIETRPNAAFQFGFAGISVNGEFAPVSIPFVQWFRKL